MLSCSPACLRVLEWPARPLLFFLVAPLLCVFPFPLLPCVHLCWWTSLPCVPRPGMLGFALRPVFMVVSLPLLVGFCLSFCFWRLLSSFSVFSLFLLPPSPVPVLPLSLSSVPLDFTFMILLFRFYFSVSWLFIAVYFVGPNRPETGFGSFNFVFLYSCILAFLYSNIEHSAQCSCRN